MGMRTAIPIHNKISKGDFGNIFYYEDVPGDNAARKYNRILADFRKSDDEWLCIHHDDLEIRCNESEVIRQLSILKESKVRVAGVIGTLALSSTFQWWNPLRPAVTAGAIIQGFDNHQDAPMVDLPGMRTDMAVVDGCVLWIHHDVSDIILPEDLPGWHCYDSEICLQCLVRGYRVGIVDAMCRHSSEGKFSLEEFDEARKFMERRWGHLGFPIVSGITSFKERA